MTKKTPNTRTRAFLFLVGMDAHGSFSFDFSVRQLYNYYLDGGGDLGCEEGDLLAAFLLKTRFDWILSPESPAYSGRMCNLSHFYQKNSVYDSVRGGKIGVLETLYI